LCKTSLRIYNFLAKRDFDINLCVVLKNSRFKKKIKKLILIQAKLIIKNIPAE